MGELKKGDYVLATKYRDGDPYDGYALGFFDGMLPKMGEDRFMVVNGAGKQYRGNGFRRCERISEELGGWLFTAILYFAYPGRLSLSLSLRRRARP